MEPRVKVEAEDLRIFPKWYLARRVLLTAFYGLVLYSLFSLSFGSLALPISVATTGPLMFLAAYRNRILTKVVNGGFASAFTFRRIVGTIFWVSTVLLIGGSILVIYPLTAKFQGISMGVGFALNSLSANWSSFMAPQAIGKLSIEQFLIEKQHGNPNYSWLRMGIRHVETRLRRFGVSSPRSSLFLGASYAILKKSPIDADLKLLSAWVGRSKTETETDILPSVQRLLTEAHEAEKAGFKPAPTLRDYLGELPWQKISYATASLAVVGGLIVAVMRFFITS